MALPYTDNFTYADQDLSSANASWVDVTASINKLRVISNKVQAGTASSFGDAYSRWTGDVFTDDQQSSVRCDPTNYSGPCVRLRGTSGGANAGGYLWLVQLGNVYFVTSTGGVTQIASGWTVLTITDRCKLVVAGTQLTGYIGAAQAGTVSDATYPTGGTPGLYASGAGGTTLDDITVDNFSAASPPFLLVRQ